MSGSDASNNITPQDPQTGNITKIKQVSKDKFQA